MSLSISMNEALAVTNSYDGAAFEALYKAALGQAGLGTTQVASPKAGGIQLTADQLSALVGKSMYVAANALIEGGISSIRYARQGESTTPDYVEGRATIFMDQSGYVTSVSIDGMGRDGSAMTAAAKPVPIPGPYAGITDEQLMTYLGMPVRQVVAELRKNGIDLIRTGKGDFLITMDFVLGRATVKTDDNGNVTSISIEGGARTDRPKPIDGDIKPQPVRKPVYSRIESERLDTYVGSNINDVAQFLKAIGITSMRTAIYGTPVSQDVVEGRATVILASDGRTVSSIAIDGYAQSTASLGNNYAPVANPNGDPGTRYRSISGDQLNALIGKPLSVVEAALFELGVTYARAGRDNSFLPTEFAEGTATMKFDESGNVTFISIEGGPTTDAFYTNGPLI